VPKCPKSKAIPAIEALHDNYQGIGPVEVCTLEDSLHDAHERLGRLGWSYASRTSIDKALLIERLAARSDWMIFPDANTINIGVEDLWPELLSRPRRLAVTTRVIAEVDGVLSKRPEHPLYQAVETGNKALLVRPDAKYGTPGSIAQDYYLGLMVSRRKMLDTLRGGFILKHGRKPNSDEEATMWKMMQSELSRERILLNAKAPSPILTDEHLVYHAVTHALETAQPTIILSGDFDVAAQFRHLIRLILSHYRSMLFAERYEQDFASFRPHSIPPDALRGFFLDQPAVHIDLDACGPNDPLPPEQPTSVAISCMTVTPQHVSEMLFKGETHMFEAVLMKGKTGGLSTDRLTGRNLHAWHVLPEIASGRGVVASDIRGQTFGSAKIAMADWLLSSIGLS
jgi:hypothetical protein